MQKTYAITYTVKNELRLLPNAIEYHRALGCSRFFIYLDGTTDSTESYFSDMSDVEVLETVIPSTLEDRPTWIRQIEGWSDVDMDVRKRINNFDAARRARLAKIEWLVSIDPDEILLLPENEAPEAFFKNISGNVDQVLFKNLEALPPKRASGNPFAECTVFLNRFPLTESVWRYSSSAVRRISGSSKIQAWYDYIFYQIRFPLALPRLMREPTTGNRIPAGYFLGYSNHKSAVRAERASDFDFIIHKWRKHQRRPTSVMRGNVLHYDLCSAQYFMEKFGQRQSSMLLPIFYLRYRLAIVARNYSVAEVTNFFEKYIAIGSGEACERLVKRGIARRIDIVASFFNRVPR